ncbi:MAG: 3-deoxy-manno-octulosonate cytidylyltransferase [Phaeodactylibacter sp.]|uniref:3-deoxy-manno-octulosonate cytidylyltransferase n=1 Tax=Phaeodactylibacter sp. TaxID=1940289 RepID=UPI0032ECEE53
MKSIAVIPARYASTRFPGKPLALLRGKTVLQHVYERAQRARQIDEVCIATDDERIMEAAARFGAKAVMTDPGHRSGTDRCAEVVLQYPEDSIVINIQGDEPFIDPAQIDGVAAPLLGSNPAQISTLVVRLRDAEALHNPNVVKAVKAASGKALYFSRSPIPFLRGVPPEQWMDHGVFFKHLGIYGFQRSVLLEVAQLPPGNYEQMESLEQLRWLEAGYHIHVGTTNTETIGIDTPEDLEAAAQWLDKSDKHG